MASVGLKLKKAREKKHLSIEEVSQKTKIHSKILEAIEEDRAENYLNKVYVKGFLKSYARFVGVGEEEVLQDYQQESPKESLSSIPTVLDTSSWEEERGISPWVFRCLVVILAVGVLFLISIGISKIKGERKIPFASPATRHSSLPLHKGSFVSYPFRIPSNEPLKLKLRANENTWMTVTSDSRLMYQGLLTKGKEEVWNAQHSFELSLTDGGAVLVGLNRKSLGIPGEKGRPIEKLSITREGWGLGEKE